MSHKKVNQKKKGSATRLLALLLCCVLLGGIALPSYAFATEGQEPPAEVTEVTPPVEETSVETPAETPVETPAETPAEPPAEEQLPEVTDVMPASETPEEELPAQESVVGETPDANAEEGNPESELPAKVTAYFYSRNILLETREYTPGDALGALPAVIDEHFLGWSRLEGEELVYVTEASAIWTDTVFTAQFTPFYRWLLDCDTCADILFLMEINMDEAWAMTPEQIALVTEKVNTMTDDEDQQTVLEALEVIASGEAINTFAPMGGGGGGQNPGGSIQECDIANFRKDAVVYYDTMSYTSGSGAPNHSDSSKIASVTLSGIAVKGGTASSSSTSASNGTKMQTYFPSATTKIDQASTLTITPAPGYYVTHVVIACKDPTHNSPYHCRTWDAGNAFDQGFTFSSAGATSIGVSASDFSHASNSAQVWVLIQVAPIPSPLYVEYDYGNVSDFLPNVSGTVFASPSGWTTIGSGNNYGTGAVETNNTQMKYAYSGTNPSAVSSWVHNTNSVTQAAKALAAENGYYFAGWEYTYYSNTNRQSSGGKINYNFSGSIGGGSIGEAQRLTLLTNCKLVGVWKPTLELTKTVTGLSGSFLKNHTYTLKVQKLESGVWSDYGQPVSITVNGNGSASVGVGLAPGTYRIVEDPQENLTEGSAVKYLRVDDGGEFTVPENPSETQNHTVTNNYTDTNPMNPDSPYILVQKRFEGLREDQIPAGFQVQVGSYTLNTGTYYDKSADATGVTYTWKISNASSGNYNITESNYTVPNYSVVSNPEGGSGTVTVTAGSFDVTADKYTQCSHLDWDVKVDGNSNVMFAAALTNQTCIVISKTPLSASQQLAVKNAIVGGNWKPTVYFYSISTNGNGPYTIGDAELYYDPDTQKIWLSATSNWSHVAKVTYNITEASSADIEITNTYRPLTTSVTIKKTVTGNMGNYNDSFPFTVTSGQAMGADNAYTLSGDGKQATFSLKHDQSVTLQNVVLGDTITVTENFGTYKNVTATVNGSSVTVTNGTLTYNVPQNASGTIEIVVTNNKEVEIDTGILLDTLPYILLLAVAGVGSVLVLKKRRRNDDF